MAWTEVARGHWPGEQVTGGYKMVAHSPIKSKSLPWLWCRRCGLVYLRNSITDWCIAKGCNYDDHTGYKSAVQRLTVSRKL